MAPVSSNTFAARDTSSRAPNQGCVPSVRSTGSQADWLRMVPNPPAEAPIVAKGLTPNTRLMSDEGRDSQSMAFLSTPWRLLWYYGVASRTAAAQTIACFSWLTAGGMQCDSTA